MEHSVDWRSRWKEMRSVCAAVGSCIPFCILLAPIAKRSGTLTNLHMVLTVILFLFFSFPAV